MELNVYSSSEDEEMENFIIRLGRRRKEKIYRNRNDHFNSWDEMEFYHRFRISKRITNMLLDLITNIIQLRTNFNHAVTSREMLLLTLRFLATGNFLITVGDFIGIHKTTAGKHIWKVLQAIANLKNRFLYFPNTAYELEAIKKSFYSIAKFPKVVGALDCTHVKIQSPGGDDGEIYRNRKQFFSINVQAICSSDLRFLNIVARWPGSAHDSQIFQNSNIKLDFERNSFPNCILLADSAYPLKKYCITPLQEVRSIGENLFNEAQIRTRNPIERAFGVWKRRFPILSTGIRLSMRKTQALIISAAVLHNIAVLNNEIEPPPLSNELQEAIDFVNNIPQVPMARDHRNIIRLPYIRYFENL